VLANPSCGYEGADIALAPPAAGDPCQQWRADPRDVGYVSLNNRFSNKVAEVAACVNADGARVAQWGWLHNDCQMFRIDPATGGWSTIRSKLNGRVLQPAACAGTGAPIQTWTASGEVCQQFRLQPVGEVLLADPTGTLALDGCGSQVTFRPSYPGPCQRWRFEHVEDGYYRVIAGTGRALSSEWRIDNGRLVDRAGTALAATLDAP
jgi:hypothetical protein